MTKGPWDSYKKLVEIRQRMNELVESSLRQLDNSAHAGGDLSSWSPPFDLVESDDALTLYGELPGISKNQIEVQLAGFDLLVKGERQPDSVAQSGAYHLSERYHGLFARSFKLPVEIDEGGIQTSLVNGVLEIRLPKRKPRQIPIQ